jgi:hypothetical protein
VVVERAYAACDQTAPVNNTTVTCLGTTNDANPPNGWGTGVETGDTITVQPGASVASTDPTISAQGIFLFSGTVNNLGTIAGGGQERELARSLTLPSRIPAPSDLGQASSPAVLPM